METVTKDINRRIGSLMKRSIGLNVSLPSKINSLHTYITKEKTIERIDLMESILNEIITILKRRGFETMIRPDANEISMMFYEKEKEKTPVYGIMVTDSGVKIGFVTRNRFGYSFESCLICSTARFSFRAFDEMFVHTKERVDTMLWDDMQEKPPESRIQFEFENAGYIMSDFLVGRR